MQPQDEIPSATTVSARYKYIYFFTPKILDNLELTSLCAARIWLSNNSILGFPREVCPYQIVHMSFPYCPIIQKRHRIRTLKCCLKSCQIYFKGFSSELIPALFQVAVCFSTAVWMIIYSLWFLVLKLCTLIYLLWKNNKHSHGQWLDNFLYSLCI